MPKFNPFLIQKYLLLGYTPHIPFADSGGLVLTHPSFEKQEGEVKETLPAALEYARRGHLVVLLPPKEDTAGRTVESPDGFLDREDQPIEFKHCTTGTANNIYNNLSDAGKHGLSSIRFLRIVDSAEPTQIALQITRKYTVSSRMDLIHILYRGRITYLTRELFLSGGYDIILSKFL